MRGVSIYLEGGGDLPGSRAGLRQGMDAFLRSLKNAARRKALHWKTVSCGSREENCRRFENAVANGDPNETKILLVDAEGSLAHTPCAHLQVRDGWDLSFSSESTIHLMVQVMETWIVADPEALAGYYGQRFNVRVLPRRPDLEQVPKAHVESGLKDATRRTSRGVYNKTRHGSELLKWLDPARVKERCRHCKRLFEALDTIIRAA